MTSRERVISALSHKEPDRVPVDFGGMRSTGITGMAYAGLKKLLGFKATKFKLYDIYQQLAEPEPDVLDRMHGDVIQLHRYVPSFNCNIRYWKDWRLFDGTECLVPGDFAPEINDEGYYEIYDKKILLASMEPEGHHGFTAKHLPLKDASSKSDIDRFFKENDQIISVEEIEYLKGESRKLRENSSRAILGAFGGNLLETGQAFFGWDEFMVKIMIEKDLIEYFLERLTEIHLQNLEIYIKAVGENIDVIQLGDDLGTQNALQISPDVYRKMIYPCQKRLFRAVRDKSDYFVFLHSCGSVDEIIPDLIDAGVQVLNPVQTSAGGMDPVKLKREYGMDLAFWGGGIDTQSVLPNGSVEEVKKDVRLRRDILAPGGGFIFNQIHNLQMGVPPENIVAAYDTIYDEGKYPVHSAMEPDKKLEEKYTGYWRSPLLFQR